MCKTISNIVLIVVNVLCIVVAAILMIVGGLLQWGGDSVRSKILPEIFKLVPNNDGQASITMGQISDITDAYIGVLGNSGLIIFVIGVILFVFGFLGVVGAGTKHRLLLIIYILLVTAIFILIVIFIVVFMVKRDQLQEAVSSSFLKVIISKYTIHGDKPLNTSSGVDITGIIDLIQYRASCCGSYNGSDYVSVFNRSTNKMPQSCCIMNQTGSFTPKFDNCTTSPSSVNSYYGTGCSTLLWTIVKQYSEYAAYSLIGLAVILFILIVMAAVLLRSVNK